MLAHSGSGGSAPSDQVAGGKKRQLDGIRGEVDCAEEGRDHDEDRVGQEAALGDGLEELTARHGPRLLGGDCKGRRKCKGVDRGWTRGCQLKEIKGV